ncbi:MAG: sulfite exporter TauE/SafE family protein [Myxococcota bacterium]|nr:sulfite exporter TauE/SafE family protein [Myxococcota bacterium]
MISLEGFILVAVGVAFGLVNTLAGGGSILSLTALLTLGLPAHLANGTNRVGGLIQSISATLAFFRQGQLPMKSAALLIPAAMLGATAGAWFSLSVPELLLKRLIALTLLLFSVLLLIPQPWLKVAPPPARHSLIQLGVAFFIGLYGGFLQAGIGILLLWMGVRICGHSPEAATALKVMTAAALTLPALIIFAYGGQVEWSAGMLLAFGGGVGAVIGARWTQRHGATIIRRALFISALLFCGKLLMEYNQL